MAGESVVEVLRGLRHIADSSVFQEYLVEEDGEVMEAAIRLLESVTAPTEPYPEAPHVQAKYWAELVKARSRITELEGELADMSALAQVNAMNVSDYSDAVEDAKRARAALTAVQQPNPEAVEALDRLTQIALDNTSEDAHEAVHEDAKRVRVEWKASRKVEAAPAKPVSDTDRRIAEAEATAKDWYEESERVSDKVVAIRHWAHDNQEHEVYEGDEDQPAECTDDCAWCALDQILNTSPPRPSQPVQVEAAEKKIAQVERYLERFNPGGTRGQDVMAQALSEILAGAEVAWAPSDDRTANGQEQG